MNFDTTNMAQKIDAVVDGSRVTDKSNVFLDLALILLIKEIISLKLNFIFDKGIRKKREFLFPLAINIKMFSKLELWYVK